MKKIEVISTEDYKNRFADDSEAHFLLDVRTVEEYKDARIPGAVNIPLDELQDRADEVKDSAGDLPVVLVCRSGVRSMMGGQMLRMAGLETHDFYNLSDGTMGWARAGHPVERDEA